MTNTMLRRSYLSQCQPTTGSQRKQAGNLRRQSHLEQGLDNKHQDSQGGRSSHHLAHVLHSSSSVGGPQGDVSCQPRPYRAYIHSFQPCILPCIYALIDSLARSFAHSFPHSFVHSVTPSIIHSLIHSCIHSCIRSRIHSVIH